MSVPVVITTPSPASAASQARWASASACSSEICAPGSDSTFSDSSRGTTASCGNAASSWSAPSAGTARSPLIAIVPPAASSRSGRTTDLSASSMGVRTLAAETVGRH